MTDKNTPAFPGRPQQDPNDVNKVIHNKGMTLRDYFAAHAPIVEDSRVIEEVEGFPVFDNSGYFNGSPSAKIRESQRQQQLKWMRQARIKWRWQYADAMIAARDE